MLQALRQNWWVLVLRGVVAILFGIAAFVWPVATTLAFVILIAVFAVVEGIFAFIGAFSWGLSFGQRLLMILIGLLGFAVGFFAFRTPLLVAATLVVFIGWWAIITGVMQIIVAIEMRKVIENEWMLILGAVLSIIFGVLLLASPLTGWLALTWLFAFYAIVFGIIMVILGVRLRSLPAPAG